MRTHAILLLVELLALLAGASDAEGGWLRLRPWRRGCAVQCVPAACGPQHVADAGQMVEELPAPPGPPPEDVEALPTIDLRWVTPCDCEARLAEAVGHLEGVIEAKRCRCESGGSKVWLAFANRGLAGVNARFDALDERETLLLARMASIESGALQAYAEAERVSDLIRAVKRESDQNQTRIVRGFLLCFALLGALIFYLRPRGYWRAAMVGLVLLGVSGSARADLADCMNATCRVTADDGGRGTGCVFHRDATTWYVLTNAHVALKTGTRCTVEFWGKGYPTKPLPATTIASWMVDEVDRDMAIVAVADAAFPGELRPAVVPLAPRGTQVEIGATVVSVGCAGGNWPTAWMGHVFDRPRPNVLHATPPAANGRSGSAVFDAEGKQIVGLIAWRDDQAGAAVAQTIEAIYATLDGQMQQSYPPVPTSQRSTRQCIHGLPLDGVTRCSQCEQCPPGGCPQPFGGGGAYGYGQGGGQQYGYGQQNPQWQQPPGGPTWRGYDPWAQRNPQPQAPVTPKDQPPIVPQLSGTPPALPGDPPACPCDHAELMRRLAALEAERLAAPAGPQGPKGEPGPPGSPAALPVDPAAGKWVSDRMRDVGLAAAVGAGGPLGIAILIGSWWIRRRLGGAAQPFRLPVAAAR